MNTYLAPNPFTDVVRLGGVLCVVKVIELWDQVPLAEGLKYIVIRAYGLRLSNLTYMMHRFTVSIYYQPTLPTIRPPFLKLSLSPLNFWVSRLSKFQHLDTASILMFSSVTAIVTDNGPGAEMRFVCHH